ncbi:hypothetical protein NitYY0826_C0413 [Nitratiruptor sp. YY08-26]|uniref:ABC-type transport auxiliary lipoprotein family protein n=1 Tax=unclassified Nitratiruptor TaxID=2624044 RepID=UPI001915BF78|nr:MULTISPECIES: ABC-type transport auxiliary lipoprotein family protein [unclassified Nitratiruptor]BCD61558.1 hypothetical protein NitYY0813_C0412 [Nitratiruptor sp. YY08-13]BCD65492.1 hypothetical protein NitYY0826_C0413 [Nitratiruptor sp. YY08-26]
MRFVWLIALLMMGCAQKVYHQPYIETTAHYHTKIFIGVADVELPDYLLIDKILVQEESERFIDFALAGEPDELLTKRLIAYLRSYLGNENVLHYPWEGDKVPRCIVKLHVDAIYIHADQLVIEGYYFDKKFVVKKDLQENIQQTFDSALQNLYAMVAKDVAKRCLHKKIDAN